MSQDMRLVVYDRAWKLAGVVAEVEEGHGTAVENGVGVATLTVAGNNPGVDALTAPGARVDLLIGGARRDSLILEDVTWHGPEARSTAEVTLKSFGVVPSWLNAPPDPTRVLPTATPAAPGAVQKFAAAYDIRTGPLETVIKSSIRDAALRVGMPLTVTADQGRGPTSRAEFRNYNLADELYPLADAAGMSVRVTPDAAHSGYLLDVTPRGSVPYTLTEESGIVEDWTAKITAPDATRGLIAGQGEKADREFVYVTNPALEAQWGDRREVFRDARDVEIGDAAKLTTRGIEALAEGAPKTSISVSLLERDGFRWGDGYQLGDRVVCRFRGIEFHDWIRRIEWSYTVGEGFKAAPKIGELISDDVAPILGAMTRRERQWKAGT